MEITCEALAMLGASLANGGVCPTTGVRVLASHVVRDVLSLMHSCGMYNYSGQFAFKVGSTAEIIVGFSCPTTNMFALNMFFVEEPCKNGSNNTRRLLSAKSLYALRLSLKLTLYWPLLQSPF